MRFIEKIEQKALAMIKQWRRWSRLFNKLGDIPTWIQVLLRAIAQIVIYIQLAHLVKYAPDSLH